MNALVMPVRRLPLRLLAVFILVPLLAACADAPDAEGPLPADDAEYVDDMAEQHAADTPDASGAPMADEEGLVTARVPYHEGVTGYYAYPDSVAEGEALPGVIVIHEWWGLNDNIEAQTRRLAKEGYRALAVDLYQGDVAATPDSARAYMQAAMGRQDALVANLTNAAEYLESQGAADLGVIGWCFGGGWSLRTALALPETVDAAVIYYGQLVTDASELAALDMPVLGIFGAEDQGIPVDSVRAFEAALGEVGVPHTVRVFEGAGHAFANPSGQNYVADAADEAWSMTTAFLAEHLQDG